MSATGLKVFDETLAKTNMWLKDIMDTLGWDDRRKAYQALRATLHSVRDRMVPDEAVHLGAQLPMLIRGIYYESWNPGASRLQERTKEEFLHHVRELFDTAELRVDLESTVTAVFSVISTYLDSGQVEQVRAMLPEEVRELWPLAEQPALH